MTLYSLECADVSLRIYSLSLYLENDTKYVKVTINDHQKGAYALSIDTKINDLG